MSSLFGGRLPALTFKHLYVWKPFWGSRTSCPVMLKGVRLQPGILGRLQPEIASGNSPERRLSGIPFAFARNTRSEPAADAGRATTRLRVACRLNGHYSGPWGNGTVFPHVVKYRVLVVRPLYTYRECVE